MNEITNKTQIVLKDLGALKADGNLWLTLPDDVEKDITPYVAGNDFYTFNVSGQEYLSHFEVFVRQPFPEYYSGYNPYTPENPPPIGYPIYDLDILDAGHAWWKLDNDAPTNIINQFTATNSYRWLNQTAGYGPDSTASLISYIPPIKQGPGHVYAGDDSQTVHRTYQIGFQNLGLIEGLNQTESLSANPGTWNSDTNSCIQETIKTGNAAGYNLPTQYYYPETFGHNLPPSDP